jgi:hypothetical protein
MAFAIVLSSFKFGNTVIPFKGEVKLTPGGSVYENQIHHVGGGRVINIPVGSTGEARIMEVTATMTKDLAKLIKEHYNNGGVPKYNTITHDGTIYKNCFFPKDCRAAIGSDVTLMFTILDYNA